MYTSTKFRTISDQKDYFSGGGFSKDFSKVMTILANETIIAGPIGPAINIWLAQ